MRFYTKQHPFSCGIDLPARSMDVCVLSQDGAIRLHRNMQAAPEPFLTAVAPDRDGLVVAVECLFTWYWLADLGTQEGMPFVLGHALSMKAIHGGKAKNDTIDAPKMAALLRGGMRPQAYVYPAKMRAPRDLLRRRTHLRRQRAALFAHVHNTTSPDNLPEIGKKIADTANRDGVAERLHAAAVHKPIAVDLALITSDDARRKDLELAILQTAKPHDAPTLYLRQTIPGSGKIRRLVWLDARHQSARFPSVQDVASSCRLVQCRQASGGKRVGTAGPKIGHAPLQWAFADAATLCWRHKPQGQKLLRRLENKHDKGNALSILAPQLGRAVYDMLTRTTAFAMALFLQT